MARLAQLALLALLVVVVKTDAFSCLATNDPLVCSALADLYYATNGAEWASNQGWADAAAGTATDYCTFFGATCDSSGRLQNLYMSYNQLSGLIPDSILSLTSLQYLYMYSSNQLSGSISESIGTGTGSLTNLLALCASRFLACLGCVDAGCGIGNLTNLLQLALLRNQLSGPIPASIGSLTNLIQLFLNNNNQLGGPIPESAGSLVNLQFLLLNNNRLSGTIPGSIGSLINLLYLDLSYLGGLSSGTPPSPKSRAPPPHTPPPPHRPPPPYRTPPPHPPPVPPSPSPPPPKVGTPTFYWAFSSGSWVELLQGVHPNEFYGNLSFVGGRLVGEQAAAFDYLITQAPPGTVFNAADFKGDLTPKNANVNPVPGGGYVSPDSMSYLGYHMPTYANPQIVWSPGSGRALTVAVWVKPRPIPYVALYNYPTILCMQFITCTHIIRQGDGTNYTDVAAAKYPNADVCLQSTGGMTFDNQFGFGGPPFWLLNPFRGVQGKPVYDDRWHLVSATFQGKTSTSYLDGKVAFAYTTPAFPCPKASMGYVVMGSRGGGASGSGAQFVGSVASVRIWSSAFSAGKHKALFANKDAAPPTPPPRPPPPPTPPPQFNNDYFGGKVLGLLTVTGPTQVVINWAQWCNAYPDEQSGNQGTFAVASAYQSDDGWVSLTANAQFGNYRSVMQKGWAPGQTAFKRICSPSPFTPTGPNSNDVAPFGFDHLNDTALYPMGALVPQMPVVTCFASWAMPDHASLNAGTVYRICAASRNTGYGGLPETVMVSLVSRNGGQTYSFQSGFSTAPIVLFANSSWAYPPISNIFSHPSDPGTQYMAQNNCIMRQPFGTGMCIWRTRNISDPTAWRCHDGTDYTISATLAQAAGVHCIAYTHTSVYSIQWSTTLGAYISLAGNNVQPTSSDLNGQPYHNFAYATSASLSAWSALVPLVLPTLPDSSDPSLIDLDFAGADRNYGQIGAEPWIYWRSQIQSGGRELWRAPLKVAAPHTPA